MNEDPDRRAHARPADASPPSSGRRSLLGRAVALGATAAGVSGAGCSLSPPSPFPLLSPDPAGLRKHFIVHGPTDLETRPAAFGDAPITPHGRLYVCNHLPFPDPAILADRSAWRLDVRGVRRPLSLSLAELRALGMNGSPIPLVHGGPLRLVVPGYFGINQIKYLKTLAFTAGQSEADVMRSEYRYRPVGEPGAPTQPTAWTMSAKSIVWPPAGRRIRRGSLLHGVAFGGPQPVAGVEISWNDGADWQAVPFSGPSAGRYAWRRFTVRVDAPRGTRRVASRSIDAAGHRQPEWRTPNAGGYGNASWRDHAVELDIA